MVIPFAHRHLFLVHFFTTRLDSPIPPPSFPPVLLPSKDGLPPGGSQQFAADGCPRSAGRSGRPPGCGVQAQRGRGRPLGGTHLDGPRD